MTAGVKNPKLQASSSREAPSPQSRNVTGRRVFYWSLELEDSLKLGAWDLELV